MGTAEILFVMVVVQLIFDVWSCWKICQLISRTEYYDIEKRAIENKVYDNLRKVIHVETDLTIMKKQAETYKTGCPYK